MYKNPNPKETDRNSPRFTELSVLHQNNPLYRGMVNHSDAIVQNGFLLTKTIQPLTIDEVEAGDLAFIGNRVGTVHSVEKNEDGQVLAVVVDEAMNYLNADDRDNLPSDYHTSRIRRTLYNFGRNEAAGDITLSDGKTTHLDSGASAIDKGYLVFLKRNTENPLTWNTEAQKIYRKNNVPLGLSVTLPEIDGEENTDIPVEFLFEYENLEDTVSLAIQVTIEEENHGITMFFEPDNGDPEVDLIGEFINLPLENSSLDLIFKGDTAGEYNATIVVYRNGAVVYTDTITITISS